MEAALQHRF